MRKGGERRSKAESGREEVGRRKGRARMSRLESGREEDGRGREEEGGEWKGGWKG